MKTDPKKSHLISLVLSLVYPSAIIFSIPSFCQAQVDSSAIMTQDPQPDIHPSEWDQDISHWKTYRNEKYQIEFKYPESLTVGFNEHDKSLLHEGSLSGGVIASIVISDSKFVLPEGSVGMDWRCNCAWVGVDIFPYSDKKWNEMKDQIKKALSDVLLNEELSSLRNKKYFEDAYKCFSPVRTNSGSVETYVLWSGLVGDVFRADFSNKEFIYSVQTQFAGFSKLASDILSTWKGPKFTNGKERVVPVQVR